MLTASTPASKPVGYLAKYVSKCDGQTFPRGIRLYGVGGLDDTALQFSRWWCAPLYVRASISPDDMPRRCLGGFYSPVSGEFVPSPYRVVIVRDPAFPIRRVFVELVDDSLTADEASAQNRARIERSKTFAREAGYFWTEFEGEILPLIQPLLDGSPRVASPDPF